MLGKYMGNNKIKMTAKSGNQDIVITREFNAVLLPVKNGVKRDFHQWGFCSSPTDG
jgi:hypothetical protein